MRKFMVGLGLAAMLAGCATTSKQLAVVEDSVHDHLAKADDEFKKFCDPVPGGQPAVSPAVCEDARPLMIATLTAGKAFAQCVLTPNTEKLLCLPPIIEAGGKAIQGLQKLPSGATAAAIRELRAAIAAAFTKVPAPAEGGL